MMNSIASATPGYLLINQVKALCASVLLEGGSSPCSIAKLFDHLDTLPQFVAVPVQVAHSQSTTDNCTTSAPHDSEVKNLTSVVASSSFSNSSTSLVDSVNISGGFNDPCNDGGDICSQAQTGGLTHLLGAPKFPVRRGLCRRFQRPGGCKYGRNCFYRHEDYKRSRPKRDESDERVPHAIANGTHPIVPDYMPANSNKSTVAANDVGAMFYPICTDSESGSVAPSVGASSNGLPAVPDFPSLDSKSCFDAHYGTEEVLDVMHDEEDKDVSVVSSLDQASIVVDDVEPRRQNVDRDALCCRSRGFHGYQESSISAGHGEEFLPNDDSGRVESSINVEGAFQYGRSCKDVTNDACESSHDDSIKSYECLFCNVLVKGADICESCTDPSKRPVVPTRKRRTATWR